MATLKYSEFTEAFLIFLDRNCIPCLPGGGEIGRYNPEYIHTEIRVVLNESGGGYIHAIGRDSDTIDFRTMDHFRSQDMVTPEQREQINKLTCAKATKIVRQRNKELKEALRKSQEHCNNWKELYLQGQKLR
jgi:hypothetical protein